MRGRFGTQSFPVESLSGSRQSPQRNFSPAPLGKSIAPSSVTFGDSFPPRGSLWVVQPYTKKRPKSGHAEWLRNSPTIGTMRPTTPKRASESERALKKGGRGATPRDSLRPGFLLEKAWIPRPGPGGEPRGRSGPAPVQKDPPAGQNSILCLQGRIPCAMITENMAILYKRNPAGGPPADKGSILWKSMVWRSNSTCDTAK